MNLKFLLPAPGTPRAVRAAWGFFLFMAAVWLVLFPIYLLTRLPQISLVEWVVAALMPGNAAVLALLAVGLGRGKKIWHGLAAGYLALNLVLTITDDFGTADLLYLGLCVGVLIFLTATRHSYRD